MVGPYVGTMQPNQPGPPKPPPLYDAPPAAPEPPRTSGGYARDAGTFDSDHFAVWGRAVATDKGLIQGFLQAHPVGRTPLEEPLWRLIAFIG